MVGKNMWLIGGLLSKAYASKELYCVCDECRTVWEDDLLMLGCISCPKCMSHALRRGLTKKDRDDLVDRVVDLVEHLCRYGYQPDDAAEISRLYDDGGISSAISYVDDWNDEEHDYTYELSGAIASWENDKRI